MRTIGVDLSLILFVLAPVTLVGVSLGLVIAFYGLAAMPVYALARRGRGPTTGTVVQAVLQQSGRCFRWSSHIWRTAHRR